MKTKKKTGTELHRYRPRPFPSINLCRNAVLLETVSCFLCKMCDISLCIVLILKRQIQKSTSMHHCLFDFSSFTVFSCVGFSHILSGWGQKHFIWETFQKRKNISQEKDKMSSKQKDVFLNSNIISKHFCIKFLKHVKAIVIIACTQCRSGSQLCSAEVRITIFE